MLKIQKYTYLLLAILCLNACSPKFNWREIKNEEPHLSILFPGKPSSHSREVQLGDNKVIMHMIATDIDGINFSLAYAKVNKENRDLNQQKKLQQDLVYLMQEGMIKNINGTKIESRVKNSIFVAGNLPNGQKINMYGKFEIKGDWIVQVILIGEERKITEEVADTFISSLSFN